MTKNIKKYNKARKHLINARESLDFWREKFVENERCNIPNIDLKFFGSGLSVREERRIDILKCINEAKQRIAKYERIVY